MNAKKAGWRDKQNHDYVLPDTKSELSEIQAKIGRISGRKKLDSSQENAHRVGSKFSLHLIAILGFLLLGCLQLVQINSQRITPTSIEPLVEDEYSQLLSEYESKINELLEVANKLSSLIAPYQDTVIRQNKLFFSYPAKKSNLGYRIDRIIGDIKLRLKDGDSKHQRRAGGGAY